MCIGSLWYELHVLSCTKSIINIIQYLKVEKSRCLPRTIVTKIQQSFLCFTSIIYIRNHALHNTSPAVEKNLSSHVFWSGLVSRIYSPFWFTKVNFSWFSYNSVNTMMITLQWLQTLFYLQWAAQWVPAKIIQQAVQGGNICWRFI